MNDCHERTKIKEKIIYFLFLFLNFPYLVLLYLLQINCFKVHCRHTWERPLLHGPHFFGDAVSFHFSSYTQFPLFQFLWQSIFTDEHELTQQITKLNFGVKREFFLLAGGQMGTGRL